MSRSGASSESVEMYMKSVAELGGDEVPVPIGRVAERLGVSPVSANEMMKRLADQDLIDHQPYKGVTLTDSGRELANSVIRRQRLWECFLIDYLHLDWAKAYDLACDLEHATAYEVENALADFLGNPDLCPHGNPIPKRDGAISPVSAIPLSTISVGETGLVNSLVPEGSEILSYLAKKKLRPGQEVTVVERAPLDGPLTLRVDSEEIDLGLNLAALVLVDPTSPDN